MTILKTLLRFRRPRRIGRIRIALSLMRDAETNPVLRAMHDALMSELRVVSRVQDSGALFITALCDKFDLIHHGEPIPFYRFSYQMDASSGGMTSRCTFSRIFASDLPPPADRPAPQPPAPAPASEPPAAPVPAQENA